MTLVLDSTGHFTVSHSLCIKLDTIENPSNISVREEAYTGRKSSSGMMFVLKCKGLMLRTRLCGIQVSDGNKACSGHVEVIKIGYWIVIS